MLSVSTIEADINGRVGIIALHGGIEAGTGSLARRVAESTGSSLFVVRQHSSDHALHVPSAEYSADHCPQLKALLDRCPVVVSLHGHERSELAWGILVGGQDRELASSMAANLRRHLRDLSIIDDLDLIPPLLRGLHPCNPVNLATTGGVQLELPPVACGYDLWGGEHDPAVNESVHGALCEFVRTTANRMGATPATGSVAGTFAR